QAPFVSGPAAPPPPPGNSLNGEPIPAASPAEAPPADAAVVPPAGDGAVPAAPSAFNSNASGQAGGPSVAVAHYDPNTGEYMTPDGQRQQVNNLAAGSAPKSWKDLLPI
ncbi:MAG: mammalian cell entry protein, partial [Mycobacterium sp.]